MLSSILFGVLGGFVRALVGIAKYFEKNKAEQKIRAWYLIFTLFVAAVVGRLAGVLANGDRRLAVIAGYAGRGFLEGLYKIRKKRGFEI